MFDAVVHNYTCVLCMRFHWMLQTFLCIQRPKFTFNALISSKMYALLNKTTKSFQRNSTQRFHNIPLTSCSFLSLFIDFLHLENWRIAMNFEVFFQRILLSIIQDVVRLFIGIISGMRAKKYDFRKKKIITEFVKLVENQFQPSRMYTIYCVHKILWRLHDNEKLAHFSPAYSIARRCFLIRFCLFILNFCRIDSNERSVNGILSASIYQFLIQFFYLILSLLFQWYKFLQRQII